MTLGFHSIIPFVIVMTISSKITVMITSITIMTVINIITIITIITITSTT